MIPELGALLGSRFTFVVGKGGVGKSTTAAGLALSLADGSRRTHLVSTDPAHSLGDVFEQELERGTSVASRCSPRLTLEELDARGRGEAWMADRARPLSELVVLGTYLDEEDVDSFLDLSLPGVDEFMGALRLAELGDEEPERIVVDTAPTGHTLRLMESDRLLEGWIRALDAMAAKAGAVQERLLRRRIRLRGEEVLDDLRARFERFRENVLGDADFLVVSRGDPLVRAETDRMLSWLNAHGLRVAAEIRVGGEPAETGSDGVPIVSVPWNDGLVGCERLRRWGKGRRAPPARARKARAGPRAAELTPEVLGRELLFFAGKGGVGKSTCAAAAALALARASPVLLVGADPAGSLDDLFEGEDLSGLRGGRLRVRQIDAEAEFDAFRDRYREEIGDLFLRLGIDASARLDREVLEAVLSAAPPGMDEIFALDSIMGQEGGEPVRVVDAAPTGHFLRLVEMPENALGWVHAMLRMLLKYRSALKLDRSAEQLLQFAKRLRSLLQLLRDPQRTGVWIVTLDGPVVTAESERLRARLEKSGLPVLGVLHNRRRPRSAPAAKPLRGREPAPSDIREIVAPLVSPPPAGSGALEEFFSRWELLR